MYPLQDWLVKHILASKPVGLPADATFESIKALTAGPLYGSIKIYTKEPQSMGVKYGSKWLLSIAEGTAEEVYDPKTQSLHYNRMDGFHTTYTTFIPSWETLDAKLFYQDNKTAFLFYRVGVRPGATYPQQTNPATQQPLEYHVYLAGGTPVTKKDNRGTFVEWTFEKIEEFQVPFPVQVPAGTIPEIATTTIEDLRMKVADHEARLTKVGL
jgi:hypothetical protein